MSSTVTSNRTVHCLSSLELCSTDVGLAIRMLGTCDVGIPQGPVYRWIPQGPAPTMRARAQEVTPRQGDASNSATPAGFGHSARGLVAC